MLIDPGTYRETVGGHLAACESCNALLRFARERGDREALAAWRVQLSAHLDTERAGGAYGTRPSTCSAGEE